MKLSLLLRSVVFSSLVLPLTASADYVYVHCFDEDNESFTPVGVIKDVGQSESITITNYPYTFLVSKNPKGMVFDHWGVVTDGESSEADSYDNRGDSLTFTSYLKSDIAAFFKSLTYTLNFDWNGGTGKPDSQELKYNASYFLPNTGNKDGYTFNGWNTKKDGSGTKYDLGQKVSGLSDTDGGMVTLYAQWKANTYTVSFDSNGGDSTPPSITVTYDSTYGTLPTVTRASEVDGGKTISYTFDKWTYNNSEVKSTTKVTVDENHTLKAEWKTSESYNQYTVTLDPDPGTGGDASVTATFGSAMPKLTSLPTRTGYLFAGYYYESTKYYDADGTSARTWNLTTDKKLSAKWDPIKYKIHFDGNGKTSGKMNDQDMVYDASTNLLANAYEKEDFDFSSWNTKKDGSGDRYGDKGLVKNLAETNNAIVTLYAQWGDKPRAKLSITKDPGIGKVFYQVGETKDPNRWLDVPAEMTVDVIVGKKWWVYGEASSAKYISDYTEVSPFTGTMGDGVAQCEITSHLAGHKLIIDPNGGYYAGKNTQTTLIGLVSNETNFNSIGTAYVEGDQAKRKKFMGWETYQGELVYDAEGKNVDCQYWTAAYPDGVYYPESDLNIRAQWKDLFLVSVKVSEDCQGRGSVKIKGADEPSQSFGRDERVTLEATPSNGYAFAEWICESNVVSTIANWEFDIRTNAEYEATFTGLWYTVYWDSCGGTPDEIATNVQFGETFEKWYPKDPKRYGFEFDGWYTKRKGGDEIEKGSRMDVPEDERTFYAHWTNAPSYTVKFDGNGAANPEAMADITMYVDQSAPLPANQFTREGYDFKCWTDQNGTAYENQAVVTNLVAKGAVATLTAVWKGVPYTVEFANTKGQSCPTIPVVYGEEFTLPKLDNVGEDQFVGWRRADDPSKLYDIEHLTVSNLTSEADATVMLTAEWAFDPGPWSTALGCSNLHFKTSAGSVKWGVDDKEHCAVHYPPSPTDPLSARMKGPGVLSFDWKGTWDEDSLIVRFGGKDILTLSPYQNMIAWSNVVVTIPFSEDIVDLEFIHGKETGGYDGDKIWISNVTWTPGEGPQPGPVPGPEDKAKPTGMSTLVDDLQNPFLFLSYVDNPVFDYRLLGTNELSAPMPWPVVFDAFKTNIGDTAGFAIPINAAKPNMFYCIVTLQKGGE